MIPEFIRVSVGTAAVLELIHMQLDAVPTTAYLMLSSESRCLANCGFCPQARESKARKDALSRIFWPEFRISEVKTAFESMQTGKSFKRICIQAINYTGFFDQLVGVIETLKATNLPISVSVPPLNEDRLKKLHELGITRIGIPLDAATNSLFENVKGKSARGPYKWETHLNNLELAQSIFGSQNVSTHLIIGLGETEFEAVTFLQQMTDSNVLTALFSFTPIKGTAFETKSPPTLYQYRKIQLARYLIINKICRVNDFAFNDKGELMNFGIPKEQRDEIIQSGIPFLTSGCPGCNRPFYNERPGERLFNYPRPLTGDEIAQIMAQFEEKMK